MDDDGCAPDTMQLGTDVVRFRLAHEGDEDQIVRVFEAAFGEFYPLLKPVDGADYLRWFREPHHSHQAAFEVAEIDGGIVNVTGGLHRDIKLGPRTLYGSVGGIGRATLPEFQRKGIGGAKERWGDSIDEPPTMVGVATRRVATRDPRKYNLPSSGRMGVYLRVLRPWPAARATERGSALLYMVPASALALWGRARSAVRRRTSAGIRIQTVPSFDERFEPFLARTTEAWDVLPVRSIEYLNWRFCDPRAGSFTVRTAEQGGEIVGYAVLHRVGPRGHIVDVLTMPDQIDVVRALLSDGVRRLAEAGSAAVECWMLREHPYVRALREAGFVRLRARSAEVAEEVGWDGRGIGPEERAVLASPGTRMHLVRADFDGI